ncbi:MAG: hypothetical protein K0V04_19215 [Deltaproteobacteria bacterium]|nr:hypothetical protein [Deltaproteobacteria bacterium]
MMTKVRFLPSVALGAALLCTSAVAIAASMSSDAKKELRKSKKAAVECKGEILAMAKKDQDGDSRRAAQQAGKTFKEIAKFCDNKVWHKGCRIKSGKGTCSFTQTDEETREEDGSTKYFPRDFR